MPDQLVRDEILDSDRWLDLASDTHRLAFFGLLLRADDFGNLEGGLRRLFRYLHKFTQVKTEEAAVTVLSALADADLARRYEVGGREFWHLPRFRTHRNYRVRKVPPSPWCAPDDALGKQVRVRRKGLASTLEAEQAVTKNVTRTLLERSSNVSAGVGVGVGVGVEVGVDLKASLSGKPDDGPLQAQAREVLDYLNANTGRSYRPVEANLRLIVARLASGATAKEMKEVVFAKCHEWLDDPAMARFLRPATLFNATKFEQYLGEFRPRQERLA